MGLKYWFPLNNSLKDRGPYNAALSVQGTSSYTAGLIGSAHSFNHATYLQINNVTLNTTYSIAAWGKTTVNGYMLWSLNCSASDRLNLYNSGSIYLNVGDGGDNPFKDTNGNALSAIYDGAWHHYVTVFNGSNKALLYIDGVYRGLAVTYRNPTISNSYIRIGGGYGGSHTYDWNGQIEDFRVYDHALSASEIYKLSKGLALHYTLDGSGGVLPNCMANSYPNLTSFPLGTWYSIIESWSMSNFLSTFGAKNGDKLTYSMYIVNKSNCNSVRARFLHYNTESDRPNTYGPVIPANSEGWSRCVITINSNYALLQALINWGVGTVPTGAVYIKQVKLEVNGVCTVYVPKYSDTAYASTPYNLEADIDGLGYNGIKTGNLTLSSLAGGRYPRSTVFNSTETIKIGNLSLIVPQGSFTFNIWFYKNKMSSTSWDTIFGGPGGFELEMKIGSSNYIHPYSWGGGSVGSPNEYSIPYTMNEWHMVTMVRTGSAAKFYLDGVLKVTGNAGSIPSGDYFIGSWLDTTHQNYAGLASDARIYATAFTDDDVMKLYRGEI